MAQPPTRLNATRLLAALLGLAALAGCAMPDFMSFPPQVRGNKVDNELLAQLVPGTSTRADATALIGSPTARATFDDNTWLYIGEVTKPVIAGTNAVLDQQAHLWAFVDNFFLFGVLALAGLPLIFLFQRVQYLKKPAAK